MEPGQPPYASEIDTTVPVSARIWNYWLGGKDYYPVDKEAGDQFASLYPDVFELARASRYFIARVVRYLAGEAGIRQFLDIGSGIPGKDNVHQMAQGLAPGSRVVYVDNDDTAVAHSRLLLRDNPDTAIIQADLREPDVILRDPVTRLLIDFSEPVALLLVAVVHFIPDDEEASGILATLRGALAPGSYVVICHNCRDGQPELADTVEALYKSRVGADLRLRSRESIARLFDGFTLLDPGLVWMPQWRPDSPGDVPENPESYWALAGVARYDRPGTDPGAKTAASRQQAG